MEGREGVGKRGQGCFLYSQLIDSQMSGGVGFVAGLKHPVTLFPSTNKHNTYARACAGEDCARACTCTCDLTHTVCLPHTHLFGKQMCLCVRLGDLGWALFTSPK